MDLGPVLLSELRLLLSARAGLVVFFFLAAGLDLGLRLGLGLSSRLVRCVAELRRVFLLWGVLDVFSFGMSADSARSDCLGHGLAPDFEVHTGCECTTSGSRVRQLETRPTRPVLMGNMAREG